MNWGESFEFKERFCFLLQECHLNHLKGSIFLQEWQYAFMVHLLIDNHNYKELKLKQDKIRMKDIN